MFSFAAFAQQATSATQNPKVFNEWIKKDKINLKFKASNGANNFTYDVNPKDGYTVFHGWSNFESCVRGRIPTFFSVADDGKLTMEYKSPMGGCPAFKFVFTPEKGPVGEIYLNQNGQWELRPSTIELVGYEAAEHQRAVAALGQSEKCAEADAVCLAKKAATVAKEVLSDAPGAVGAIKK